MHKKAMKLFKREEERRRRRRGRGGEGRGRGKEEGGGREEEYFVGDKGGEGFPGGAVVICLPMQRDTRDTGLIPGSESSPGERNDNSLQYSCLESFMDRGVWWAIVHSAWGCNELDMTEHVHATRGGKRNWQGTAKNRFTV